MEAAPDPTVVEPTVVPQSRPAVIVGHVDSRRGPAVFFDLPLLDPGDRIHVDRRDGTTVIFLVERIEQHPKNAFPTEVSAALTYSGGAKNG